MVVLGLLTNILHLFASPIIACTIYLLDEDWESGFRLDDLPDDILMNALSRIPACDLLIYREVCKRWSSLISSHHFIQLQRESAPTIVLGQCLFTPPSFYKEIHFVLVEDPNTRYLKTMRLKPDANVNKCTPLLIDSFGEDGLLLFLGLFVRDFKNGSKYLVINPISRESKFLEVPCDSTGKVCGLFFHPLERSKYKILCWENEGSNGFGYYIHDGSGSNSRRRIKPTPVFCRPANDEPPILLHSSLHWIVNHEKMGTHESSLDPCMHTIMVFKIDTEQIFTLPHPKLLVGCEGGYFRSLKNHLYINLFEMDKQLCMSHIFLKETRIYLWILKDYGNWDWSKWHTLTWIRISKVPRNFTQEGRDCLWHRTKIVNIKKDVFLVNWFGTGLYCMNLAIKTFKRLRDPPNYQFDDGVYLCTAHKIRFAMPKGADLV